MASLVSARQISKGLATPSPVINCAQFWYRMCERMSQFLIFFEDFQHLVRKQLNLDWQKNSKTTAEKADDKNVTGNLPFGVHFFTKVPVKFLELA
jgi:hypothetical protein